MDTAKKSLVAADYVVFVALLLVSSVIGVYFAFKDRKNATTNTYYFADRQMNPIAVGMSVAVTYLSSVTMIGVPAETYIVGTVFMWASVMIGLVGFFTAVYYVPLYCRLHLKNIYEYLEMRFNVVTRKVCSAAVVLGTIFYMSTTVYLPALALSAVTPIEIHWSILITSVICTFYTTLGGIKAVIWTDVIQALMMLVGVVSVFIRGVIEIGGIDQLTKSLTRGKRYTFTRFDNYDVASRVSPIAVMIGVFTAFLTNVGLSQPAMQRFQSCKTKFQAQMSLVAYAVSAIFIATLTIGNGLLMYAYFEGCDPVKSGKLKKLDQGVPYMALELFEDYPGMTGLFVAAIFSGSLSTVSSGVNSFSKVILDEAILPKWPRMSERTKIIIGKIFVVVLGVITMAVAYLIDLAKGNVFRVMGTVSGVLMGPVFGLFILGFFVPWANKWGATIGVFLSYGVVIWIFIGSIFFKTMTRIVVLPPTSTDMCFVNVSTSSYVVTNTTASVTVATDLVSTIGALTKRFSFDQEVYNVNFHYFYFTGIALTFILGFIFSLITGPTAPSKLNPKLFIPLIDSSRFHPKVRYVLRLGVPVIDDEDEEKLNSEEIQMDKI